MIGAASLCSCRARYTPESLLHVPAAPNPIRSVFDSPSSHELLGDPWASIRIADSEDKLGEGGCRYRSGRTAAEAFVMTRWSFKEGAVRELKILLC